MPNQLIECISNFSEARRPEVIDQIVAAVQSVDEVKLLDRSSDLDHNRTVLTFAGPPFAVEEAAFRAIKTASELINMDHHTGEHPRIGATDVVPFVPLNGASMDDCIAIAKRLGERPAGLREVRHDLARVARRPVGRFGVPLGKTADLTTGRSESPRGEN